MSGRVGCFCTQNCWDTSTGSYMHEIFRRRGNLCALFAPRDTELTPSTNHITYDKAILPTLDALVVEIQDVGVRYFNYTKDVMCLMEDLLTLGDDAPALYVVDHLNPAGRVVEGSIPQEECEAHVPRVAHRHGLTLGELCNLYYSEIGAKFPLHIISAYATSYNRELLPWTIAPSSDIPGLFTCMVYSGGGLWNNTNITPAIGTARPYEYLGAPFVQAELEPSLPVPQGVLMRPCTFTPSAGQYQGLRCGGFQIILLPGYEYHSLLHTVQLIRYFMDRYPGKFSLTREFHLKLSDPVLESYLLGEISFQDAKEHVKVEEQKWIRKARRFTLYDDPPVRMK